MSPEHASIRFAAVLALVLYAAAPRAAGRDAAAPPTPDDDESLFLALFGEAPPAESPDDMLLVAEVAVECPPSLDEAYVRSFARPIRVGRSMSARELGALLERVRERMSLSNMFYDSIASYERLEREAGADGLVAVRVLLRASEGFWWGFNFSPWDLSIGYGNLGGAGKRLGAVLGLDTQAASYRDPSIAYGPFYWSAATGHRVTRRSGDVDPTCLYEECSAEGEFGADLADDLSLGLALGFRAFRSPGEYFLYPDYSPPSESSLAGLGVSRGFSSLASAGLRAAIGSYGYLKRGGLKAKAAVGIDALASSSGGWRVAPRMSALGLARLDAPRLLRLTLRERITYIPRTAGAGLPEILWASADDLRCASGLVSGELASVSRVSLDLDRIAAVGLGFAELGIVPEFFYELGAVRREAYSDGAAFQQDVGFLIKGFVSMPVGRTFALGLAFGVAGESASEIKFVFEVE